MEDRQIAFGHILMLAHPCRVAHLAFGESAPLGLDQKAVGDERKVEFELSPRDGPKLTGWDWKTR